jgi:PadR family transcriptional regulator AphA
VAGHVDIPAELRHWLVETEPEGTRRNDVLLRVFFLGLVEPGQAQAFLARRAALMTERHDDLRRLEGSLTWGDDPLSVYGHLVLEWGLRSTAMQREWAEWAADQVEARIPAT